MGQKVNANGLRVGINRDWESKWFANGQDYSKFVGEDIKIRNYLEPLLKEASVSHIEIERKKIGEDAKTVVIAFVARPGSVIGQDGAKSKEIENGLRKLVKNENVDFKVEGVVNPDLDATLIAKWIASQLENRQSFRSTQKKAIQMMRRAGALGCRTQCQGRLGGAEIARREGYKDGVVPLETLKADIEYAAVAANTAYGNIGVKVWICRPEGGANAARPEERDNRGPRDHGDRRPRRPARGGNDNASASTR